MIDVAFTPTELRDMDTAVVIDVLRATSTVTQALAVDYREVVCVESVEQAASWRRQGRVLAGERRCVMPPGFDVGNSPRAVAQHRGDVLVLATTNGTPAILAASHHARRVLLASLLNLGAVISALREPSGSTSAEVQIVCSGTDGSVALEDVYVAGRLCSELRGGRSDSALVAEAVARGFKSPLQALAASRNAAILRAAGLGQDVAYCGTESTLQIVPQVASTAAGAAVVVAGTPDIQDAPIAAERLPAPVA